MRLSRFGERFARRTGARELMEDLGAALAADPPPAMLGGGNPARIPAVQDFFGQRLAALLADPANFRRLLGDYADPAGELGFRRALADRLRRDFGWPVTAEHVALTGGSQQGFFLLFNLLAGTGADGIDRRILLPLTPEYVGYADVGVAGDLFTARKPVIELTARDRFKYRVDFAALDAPGELAAVCVSRPTNPSGNVLADAEVAALRDLARRHDVPLIIDGAYGHPFPGLVHVPATPVWDEGMVLLLSLSKLGLPGARTGIVVAAPELVRTLASATAVTSLAVGSVGPVLARDALASGDLDALVAGTIRPWYRERRDHALAMLEAALAGCAYRVHEPEGAFFLWLWLPELAIGSAELYARLKARGVLVLSGHHFFPGLPDDGRFAHRHQCLRVSYASDSASLQRGLTVLAEEVRRARTGS